MRYLIILSTLIFVSACSKRKVLNIDLHNNDCVINQPMDYLPSLSYLQNYGNDSVQFDIINTEGKTRIFRMKNMGNESIYFLEPINIKKYVSLPVSNKGSLWINESSESKAYNTCVLENNYSISISKLKTESIISLTLYSGMELKPDEEFDIELQFSDNGTYRLIIIHAGSKNATKSVWGLNKTHQVISEKFVILN